MRIDLTHDDEDLAIDPALRTVGYFRGMRIVVDIYMEDVYYEVLPKSMFNYNDALFMERLRPLSILPREEAAEVMKWLEEIDVKRIMEKWKEFYELEDAMG